MKRIMTTILSLIILLALSACQPTPEKATVVQKDSDLMLEAAHKEDAGNTDTSNTDNSLPEKSLSEQYGIPVTYTYDGQGADGLLNIHVDAQVVVPEGSTMPIYRVQQAEFSQETVSAFFDSLCGDAEMWVPSGQRTKDEIQEAILNIKRDVEQGVIPDAELEEAKQELASLEEQLQTAPDTVTEERADGTLREITETRETSYVSEPGAEKPEETTFAEVITYTGFNAYERCEDSVNGRGMVFQVNNDSNPTLYYSDDRNSAAGVNFGSSASLPILEDENVDAEILSEIGLLPSEAKQMVQELLDKTDSGMVVDSIYLQDDEQLGNYDGITRPAEQYVYKVYCVRTVDELACSCVGGGSRPDASDMIAPPWTYESLYFGVNSEGIFRMRWRAPIGVVETVGDDAQIKPFSEIQEIFEKMMSVKYEAQAEFGGSEYDFDISRVTLSLHRIIEQNSNESGLLVPAWNFYGKLMVKSADGWQHEELGESFLTINAIDGSVIDTSKGY